MKTPEDRTNSDESAVETNQRTRVLAFAGAALVILVVTGIACAVGLAELELKVPELALTGGRRPRLDTQGEGNPKMADPTDKPYGWYNFAGHYQVCGHEGCSKKVTLSVTDHDCCGRCRKGRDCPTAAQRSYDGPGYFVHSYSDSILSPGVCVTCGEPPEIH
jgi:hypothetical protein